MREAADATKIETPLRLNFAMLIAKERQLAILDFAEHKFSVPDPSKDEDKLFDVLKAMISHESLSQNILAHLGPEEHRSYSKRSTAKLVAVTAQDLQASLPSLTEAKIAHALALLSTDASEIVTKISFDQQLLLGRYAIDWQAGLRVVRTSLVD